MLEREAEKTLAGAALHIEDSEGILGDLGGDGFERRAVEGFFVAKVVVEECLIDLGGGGDGAGARAGEAMLAELANGGVEDAGA